MPPKGVRRSLELKRDIASKRILECLSAAHEAKADSSRLPIFLSRFSRLETHFAAFETHHLKLCSEIDDDDELDEQDALRQSFDDKYFEIINLHSELISTNAPASSNDSNSQQTDLCSVKTPRLNLLHFDGDTNTWGSFYDMFNKMIHQNKRLSNIERFSILLSILHGEPLHLLKGFPLSENNYLDAYAALVDRYQCKRKLAFRYWEEIQKVKMESTSPRELRRVVDTFNENIAALKNLRLPVKDWDFPLFHLLINKLDVDTRRRFELQNDNEDIPSFDSLLKYLNKAGQALELAEPDLTIPNSSRAVKAPAPPRPACSRPAPPQLRPSSRDIVPLKSATRALVVSSPQQDNNTAVCVLCKSNHNITGCPSYRNRSPRERFALVKENNLCVNCLRSGHVVRFCPSKSRCFKCNVPHHTTIHFDNYASAAAGSKTTSPVALLVSESQVVSTPAVSSSGSSNSALDQPAITLVAASTPITHTSLLATALVEVSDSFGIYRKIRVVVDSGSQSNFITKKCAQRLGLPLHKTTTVVEGIGQSSSVASNSTVYRMRGVDCNAEIEVEALTIPKICSEMPTGKVDAAQWPRLKEIKLADPNFNLPANIDALVGVDIFCKIFMGERIDIGPDGPTLYRTSLGWVVMGRISNLPSPSKSSLFCSLDSIDSQLRRFWEVEEIPKSEVLSDEDALCEEIFVSTHTRDENGRYVVRLPFKSPEPTFGDSYTLAHRRLLSLERRLSRDLQLREEYNAFMKDYLEAQHMELAEQPPTNETYYIPHHCVLKPSSTSTRLRTVFDATARPVTGPALNDMLLVGPKLQADIGSLLLRFRLHAVVFTADMRQMYRQILVSEKDRDYQRILFRFSAEEPVAEYRLNTVTYGMASSSFLALRTILQVAQDEGKDRPLGAAALSKDVYVDDVVTGAPSLESARELQRQIIEILQRGCFELRKWTSNHPSLLENIPPEHRHDQSLSFDSEDASPVKILGLKWSPSKDSFSFAASPLHEHCTKRNVLSELARIFDPLGLLTPLTLAFKCIIQKLWSLGLDWDSVAPDPIAQTWARYRSELNLLASLNLPRFVPALNAKGVEMHGFCDASESGFAAVIFLRVQHCDDSVTTHLMMSRSKVAPLKRVSIPRLELCAAVLLSDLIEHVKEVFAQELRIDKTYCWSDSTITLAWLQSPSARWKTYVSNRVSHIQERAPPCQWRHVRSECNPADCASRGLTVRELLDHSLWWSGPEWLSSDPREWPFSPLPTVSPAAVLEERKAEISLFVAVEKFDDFLERHSSLKKVQRIVAYIHRFVHNCRRPNSRKTGHLVASELNDSLLTLVKLTQASTFSEEIECLKSGKPVSKSLRKLQPFVDKDDLLRVGGRLAHSDLDYDCKHPLLLPRQHRLTSLVIDQAHNDHQHPGLRTLSFLLAQTFWILSPRRAIHSRLSKCIKCFRTNPRPVIPLMGDLPRLRISQVKAFSCIGIDFAGPFPTHIQRYRGSRTFKTYVCLFVCFATKAIHMELVTGLTSEAFLGALRRFIARRGRCQRIHCDQGTNFVGGYNMLSSLMQTAAATETIEFSFNPPAAPHFGGLWEINVKAFKTHLARVVGNQILTYEEFLTVITQIEALLNSRPLCEMGSDPNDMSVLTPGHFLTLEPLTTLPEPLDSNQNISCLNRWRLVQRLHHDFWKRWHVEYLHTLTQRAKWHTNASEPKIGSLVLIKDEQIKPLYWSLGRIVQLHPGRDGVNRVATVKTQTGQFQRPLVKLCPLPLDI